MDTLNKPKNQNPDGLHDLGQIDIKAKRFKHVKDRDGLTICPFYYGNQGNPGGAPDDHAQVAVIQGPWNTAGFFTAGELREIAAQFCDAARQIELGLEIFEAEKYLSNIERN